MKRVWLTSVVSAARLRAAGRLRVCADPVRVLKTIAINGTASAPTTPMFSFGSSFVDPASGLYYLADRSNAALDVIDTTGAFTGSPDTLYGQVGGAAFTFAGDTGGTASAAPHGV